MRVCGLRIWDFRVQCSELGGQDLRVRVKKFGLKKKKIGSCLFWVLGLRSGFCGFGDIR